MIHQSTFRTPMTHSANTYVRQLPVKNTDGQVFISEAGTSLAKSMLVGNAAKHALERPELGSGNAEQGLNRPERIFVASSRFLT